MFKPGQRVKRILHTSAGDEISECLVDSIEGDTVFIIEPDTDSHRQEGVTFNIHSGSEQENFFRHIGMWAEIRAIDQEGGGE